ncbi:hypothetical protein DFH07DRAFT_696173, partial [Mycena maculata]
LWEERHVVQEQLDAYKYPVLTLPDEIVSEIFLDCLPVCRSPMKLGQICSQWRDIAVSSPTLW